MKLISKKQFMKDLLSQPNTVTATMIERMEEMLDLLTPLVITELYFALMNDSAGVNKIKNGLISMQYFYHYYKQSIHKQIRLILQEEFERYINNEPLLYGDDEVISSLKNKEYFDEYIDIKEYLKSVITQKISVYIFKEEE